MDQQTRIKKIQEVIDQSEAFGVQEIPWEDDLQPMNVYKIPLAYLVYNKYNGRILSRTKTLEKQSHSIDVESPEGKAEIEKLLWDSKIERNKKTLEDLKSGQKKVGIITRDGIIIDGNRRAMLLNKLEKYDYFKAIVLPVTLEENPLEIKKLETTYQMGEDEKVDYNAIEKYLKAKDIFEDLTQNFNKDVAIKKIASWMDVTEGTVADYLDTLKVMDEYLDYLGYDNLYTQLDDREDQFLVLTQWLDTFYGEQSSKAFDGYKDDDVDDLKIVSFDYIRDKYEGKEFRNIASGFRENHIFGSKQLWQSFANEHFETTEGIKEFPIDLNSEDLASQLNNRDKNFQNQVHEKFEENIKNHIQRIQFQKESDKPEKLLKKSIEIFDAIKQSHKSFTDEKAQIQLEEFGHRVLESLAKNSPEKLLHQIDDLLASVDPDGFEDLTDDEYRNASEIAGSIQKKLNKIRENLK